MELKFALRSLRTLLAVAILAVAILALGIGANTAIFSVVNGVLLRPVEYRDPDRIVSLGTAWRDGRKTAIGNVSQPDFDDMRQQTTAYQSLASYSGGGSEGSSIIVRNAADFASLTTVSEDSSAS